MEISAIDIDRLIRCGADTKWQKKLKVTLPKIRKLLLVVPRKFKQQFPETELFFTVLCQLLQWLLAKM